MRKKVLALIVLIGILVIALGEIIICDIGLFDVSANITTEVDYWTIDNQLHIDITEPPMFRYIILDIDGADNKIE